MYRKYFKRPMDILLSLCALIILSPIMLIVAILVRTKLGSPAIYTQDRLGKDEEIFKIYKFRTMTDERDEKGELLSDNKRLTKLGKILRSSSLDELPGLINILKGNMSIVGPRPLIELYLPYYTEKEKHRHDVRSGVTGLAQINGRNNLRWDEKFEYDFQYIEKITFLNDIKIIFLTVKIVFRREGIQNTEEALHIVRAEEICLKEKNVV